MRKNSTLSRGHCIATTKPIGRGRRDVCNHWAINCAVVLFSPKERGYVGPQHGPGHVNHGHKTTQQINLPSPLFGLLRRDPFGERSGSLDAKTEGSPGQRRYKRDSMIARKRNSVSLLNLAVCAKHGLRTQQAKKYGTRPRTANVTKPAERTREGAPGLKTLHSGTFRLNMIRWQCR